MGGHFLVCKGNEKISLKLIIFLKLIKDTKYI